MTSPFSARAVPQHATFDTTAQIYGKRPPALPKLPDITFKLLNRDDTGIRLSDDFRTFGNLVGADKQPLLGTVFEHSDMELHVYVCVVPWIHPHSRHISSH